MIRPEEITSASGLVYDACYDEETDDECCAGVLMRGMKMRDGTLQYDAVPRNQANLKVDADINSHSSSPPPEQIQTQAQQPQLKYSRRASTGKAKNAANQTPEKSMEDFMLTIALALEEGSIHEKKTTRLYECLDAGSWSEVAYTLLCENIPLKRKGKGYYACRVCQVPKKGHDCMYCDICSTPNDKHEKTDVHVCINCPRCFKIGKRNKKLVQIRSMGHECPHAM